MDQPKKASELDTLIMQLQEEINLFDSVVEEIFCVSTKLKNFPDQKGAESKCTSTITSNDVCSRLKDQIEKLSVLKGKAIAISNHLQLVV